MAFTQSNAAYIAKDVIAKEPTLAQDAKALEGALVGAGYRYKPVATPRYLGGFRRRRSMKSYRRRSMKGYGRRRSHKRRYRRY